MAESNSFATIVMEVRRKSTYVRLRRVYECTMVRYLLLKLGRKKQGEAEGVIGQPYYFPERPVGTDR